MKEAKEGKMWGIHEDLKEIRVFSAACFKDYNILKMDYKNAGCVGEIMLLRNIISLAASIFYLQSMDTPSAGAL